MFPLGLEHTGAVQGDTSLAFLFKAREMNDVLKTLTVFDLDGGKVSTIGYESTKPPHVQLEDVALNLDDGSVMTSLIAQLKGARGHDDAVLRFRERLLRPVTFLSAE